MPRLNEQFMEALTDGEGKLRFAPRGYELFHHEHDGLTVNIAFNPWMEPSIGVRGILKLSVLKGGIRLDEKNSTFREGGLYSEGLHMGIEDSYGDRRYWITDTDSEEVNVSYWDPNANTEHPDDGSIGGQYGDYSPVPEEAANVVKELASGIINAAKIAVDSQLTQN